MAISKIGSNATGFGSDLTITDGDLLFATAAKGVVLGVTSNTDSNTIDDYEEGLYTATFTCGTSGTIAINSSYDQMSYTKVGRIVTVTGSIVSSTVSSPVGTVRINLPFTIASQTEDSADFAIAIMDYKADAGAPSGNSAGIGSLCLNTNDDTLYVRVA